MPNPDPQPLSESETKEFDALLRRADDLVPSECLKLAKWIVDHASAIRTSFAAARRAAELERKQEASHDGRPKCEACGHVGTTDYIRVRTTNGGLLLCVQCLGDINKKNPALKRVAALVERWRAVAKVIDNCVDDEAVALACAYRFVADELAAALVGGIIPSGDRPCPT